MKYTIYNIYIHTIYICIDNTVYIHIICCKRYEA